jgi:hypothetical protein
LEFSFLALMHSIEKTLIILSFSDKCTDTTAFSLDSFNIKAITNNAVVEINNTERTVNISLYTVPPKIPANAGLTINPRLDDIDNLPKFCFIYIC